jgi:hypothetical protein
MSDSLIVAVQVIGSVPISTRRGVINRPNVDRIPRARLPTQAALVSGLDKVMPRAGASMVQLAPRLLWPTAVANSLTSAPVMADKVAANVLSRPVLQA